MKENDKPIDALINLYKICIKIFQFFIISAPVFIYAGYLFQSEILEDFNFGVMYNPDNYLSLFNIGIFNALINKIVGHYLIFLICYSIVIIILVSIKSKKYILFDRIRNGFVSLSFLIILILSIINTIAGIGYQSDIKSILFNVINGRSNIVLVADSNYNYVYLPKQKKLCAIPLGNTGGFKNATDKFMCHKSKLYKALYFTKKEIDDINFLKKEINKFKKYNKSRLKK